jgi:hypothetical protein
MTRKDMPAWGSHFDTCNISLVALLSYPTPLYHGFSVEHSSEFTLPTNEHQCDKSSDPKREEQPTQVQTKKRSIKDSANTSNRASKRLKCNPVIRAEQDAYMFKKTVASNMTLMNRWNVNGMVNIRIATENRPRSTAMDVIAIWLGMKMMKDMVLECTNITAARKVVRTHTLFKNGYDIWKKNMLTSDDALKQVFQVNHVTPNCEIEEFVALFSSNSEINYVEDPTRSSCKITFEDEEDLLHRPEKEEISIRDDVILCAL